MPTLSTTAKVALGLGLAATLVGAVVMYQRSVATQDDDESSDEESSDEEEEAEAKGASDSAAGAGAGAGAGASEAGKPSTATTTTTTTTTTTDGAASGPVDATTVRPVSREEMVKLLNAIFQKTQMLAQRLIMQQNSKNPLPAEALKQTFDMNSEMIHQELLRSMKINHPSFMAAMQEHKGDPVVRQLMSQTYRITQLMEQMAVKLPEVPSDMTADKFLPFVEKFMDALVSGTQEAIDVAKKSGLEGDKLAQFTMEQIGKTVPVSQDACLEELGMSKELFQACLRSFMTDPRVQAKVTSAQQQAFQLVKDSSPSISDEHLM